MNTLLLDIKHAFYCIEYNHDFHTLYENLLVDYIKVCESINPLNMSKLFGTTIVYNVHNNSCNKLLDVLVKYLDSIH